ncbi:MAG: hypothetical protein HC905_26010 [Bacteroidales bacterium]|nr:hypothetical protein [Bacteroidales bacterium]
MGGEGGDELLGGYTWLYNNLVLMNQLKNVSFINQSVIQLFAAFEKGLSITGIANFQNWRKKDF